MNSRVFNFKRLLSYLQLCSWEKLKIHLELIQKEKSLQEKNYIVC